MIAAETLAGAGSSNALPAAVLWVQSLLIGSLGTAVAMLAVAGVGFAMLAGRVSARDGMRVVLGCFLLFGASTIAAGLTSLAHGLSSAPDGSEAPPAPPVHPPIVTKPAPYDPYAGASVPG